jgi:hypothetical protein
MIWIFPKMGVPDPKKNTFLVGGFNPSEKYDFVSWDDY